MFAVRRVRLLVDVMRSLCVLCEQIVKVNPHVSSGVQQSPRGMCTTKPPRDVDTQHAICIHFVCVWGDTKSACGARGHPTQNLSTQTLALLFVCVCALCVVVVVVVGRKSPCGDVDTEHGTCTH